MSTLHKQMADFWAEFLPQVHRDAFCAALIHLLNDDGGEDIILYNDYDPSDKLLSAVREAGIECRGYMFSGTDLGFPRKTGTRIVNGVVLVKYGYGAQWEPLQ